MLVLLELPLGCWMRTCHIGLRGGKRICGSVWKPSDRQHSCASLFIFCLILRDAGSLISWISGGRGAKTFHDSRQSLPLQVWLHLQDLTHLDHHRRPIHMLEKKRKGCPSPFPPCCWSPPCGGKIFKSYFVWPSCSLDEWWKAWCLN